MNRLFLTAYLVALMSSGGGVCRGEELPPAVDRRVVFATDVRPVLENRCWGCHGPEKQESGLRLDDRDAVLAGGDLGPVVVLHDSLRSRLIEYVSGIRPDNVMPPEGDRLTAEQVGVLRAWIDQGCEWPADESAVAGGDRRHWAWQPLNVTQPPVVREADRARNAIDQFVIAELEKRGTGLAPEADRYTLIRRISLDLTGLLPSVTEVDAFVADIRPDAWEILVDRLLASPHFGERWARHWLDLARYADSDGYEKDNPRPDAWRWRDWVIDAINADMPFDQFTIEQLAGDLLPEATPMQRLATAFHRQTLTNTEGGTDKEQFRVEACFDRTETTGAVWLGLTVGCARCHSHKYDPISQREYYQLFAVFNNGDEQTTAVPKSADEVAAYPAARAAWDTRYGALTERLKSEEVRQAAVLTEWQRTAVDVPAAELTDSVRMALKIAEPARTEAQRQELREFFSRRHSPTKELLAELDELKKLEPQKPELTVRVITQRVTDPRRTFVLKRGEFLQPVLEREATPGGLAVLPPMRPRSAGAVSDRLDLAQWLVSSENPLTPRVAVNHVWRLLFGSGIVSTPGDFGVRGELPSHPELLDWLSASFNGQLGAITGEPRAAPWSRKALIRRIVLSSTYRQASRHRPDLADKDPYNRLLSRQNRVRVEGEIVRDLNLDAAGLLSRRIGGPSVYPPLPAGIAELSYAGNFKWTESAGDDRFRRGMYTFFKRTAPHPNLTTFDCPDANLACLSRQTSNTPLQALTSLNNGTFAESSRGLARRILSLPLVDDNARLVAAFRTCLARPPSAFEQAQLLSLLQDSCRDFGADQERAILLTGPDAAPGITAEVNAGWIVVCRILLNLDEFICRE